MIGGMLKFCYVLIFIQVICYSFVSPEKLPQNDEDICALVSCTSLTPTNSSIEKFCNQSRGLLMRGRCCLDLSTNAIYGVDLSWCNISHLGSMLHEQAPQVVKLNLTFNPNLRTDNKTFRGLTKVKVLSLPSQNGCPSNWTWFNTTWKAWNFTNSNKHYEVCYNQTDTCATLKTFNYSCPENSQCRNDGPGMFQCLCSHGWTGYKCVRHSHGKPSISILIGSFGSATLLSVFFWLSERKNAINR
ncbi:all-trans retinoic acid-induced differentiation factor-like isoform X1 [Clavelina lepadiformis]|uniref:all-trans retinoic acid-induced differentiation factor-like isoform X1 n=1 Tax=Clavelina lepadiformis TaxID=159417 RepID=UPI004042238F